MKHTAGPWYVQNDSRGNPGVRSKGGYICFTPSIMHYPEQDERYVNELEEREGDARLMAAALDLFDTIVKLEEETWAPIPDEERFLRMRNIAQAAIARAEGRA